MRSFQVAKNDPEVCPTVYPLVSHIATQIQAKTYQIIIHHKRGSMTVPFKTMVSHCCVWFQGGYPQSSINTHPTKVGTAGTCTSTAAELFAAKRSRAKIVCRVACDPLSFPFSKLQQFLVDFEGPKINGPWVSFGLLQSQDVIHFAGWSF